MQRREDTRELETKLEVSHPMLLAPFSADGYNENLKVYLR